MTVSGSAAIVSGDNFLGLAALAPGATGTVSVVATDSNGNSRTNHYQTVVPAQPSYSPTFDADGNELTNGAGQSYTWDVKNELIQIAQASGTSAFAYDPVGHRISETDNGTLAKQWVWDGNTMAEERNASNTVTKRFFAQGEQISGTACYYTRDHLGSVREMTTGTSGTILARYDYDPYGRPTQIQGTLTSDFQYAGYYEHAASGLNLTQYRAYDPITSRWLSRDPLGERGGINLYDYVGNNPIIRIDPLGLWQVSITVPVFTGLGVKVTFGNNGGSGWFNGQWNAGGYIGAEMGEGAIDVNLHDSGCHEKGTNWGLNGSVEAGEGSHMELEGGLGTMENTGGISGNLGPFSAGYETDGSKIESTGVTIGAGEAAFLGAGETTYW